MGAALVLAVADCPAAVGEGGLKLAGFSLPSLYGDIPTITDGALVHLGGASAELVRELAAWIRQRA
ncbi:hypothetical protein R2B67_22950 [Streptomyces cyaneofuscatus]|uniref:hypothetical protein n=1 Tax=Streptomyces cyaneofuscatus TaxID=66883 RepID=UPI0029538233|nr:hypothetical protein [Streptomyces cyaneofuscatus]WOP11213.1 hypothetical protein R2B67_22950 [Streptomyces cyaneofuscatus]